MITKLNIQERFHLACQANSLEVAPFFLLIFTSRFCYSCPVQFAKHPEPPGPLGASSFQLQPAPSSHQVLSFKSMCASSKTSMWQSAAALLIFHESPSNLFSILSAVRSSSPGRNAPVPRDFNSFGTGVQHLKPRWKLRRVSNRSAIQVYSIRFEGALRC